MSPARAVHFALQACRSLAEAHEHGIVHRDIKPANLFVTRIDDDEDGLKVLDFGVARVYQPDLRTTLSNPGTAVGTPAFIAPELLVGSGADERSDLYSLGATIYDLLTASPPFSGDTVHAVFAAHLTDLPVPPSVRLGTPLSFSHLLPRRCNLLPWAGGRKAGHADYPPYSTTGAQVQSAVFG